MLREDGLQGGLGGVAVPGVGVPLPHEFKALLDLVRAKAGNQGIQDVLGFLLPLRACRLHHRPQLTSVPQLKRHCRRSLVVIVLKKAGQQPSMTISL
jgi:hypothetical protein